MKMYSRALLSCLLLSLSLPAAQARESCAFLRDPAFYARTPVAPARLQELTVGTLNVYRLFDDEQDGNESILLTGREFRERVERIARYIVRDMGAPQVIALQEVEDDTALGALAAALGKQTGRPYRAVLGGVSGDGDMRNALLVDTRVQLRNTVSLFARAPRDGKPLHDRLPLVADLDAGDHGALTVVVVHMKSMRGMDRGGDAGRVISKRRFQAQELANWVRAQRADRRLLVLGDFNAPVTGSDDERGEPLHILAAGGLLVDPAGRFLKPSQRWTYKYRCLLQQIDHVLVSPSVEPQITGYAIARGDTCIRAREKCDVKKSVSDHDGVVLRLGRKQ
ncbi:MAG: endonuclease/exonuclease/phosphatase family protein [Gammaproteobacteria bacterium]